MRLDQFNSRISSSNYEFVGYSGTGTFLQAGGSHTLSQFLSLGYQKGSSGYYELTGGFLSSTSDVGYAGTGIFTQSGGTNYSFVRLGYNSGSTGIYNLNDGIFSEAIIGISGTGIFNQMGGTNTKGFSHIGYYYGSSGSYNLVDGQLSNSRDEYIGSYGNGSFTQSGGFHRLLEAFNHLYLGYGGSITGNYNLTGGELTASWEHIGYYGKGIFTQTGGTNINSLLFIGDTLNSNGSYDLSGGLLLGNREQVGNEGKGVFTQSAGINSASFISIGSLGTYTLTGGTLKLSDGLSNEGLFDLTGSTATINLSSAIVNLSNATLINAQNVVFNLDSNSLLIFPSGLDPYTYFTQFNPNGALIHQTGSTLTISSGQTISGSSIINDFIECRGGTLNMMEGIGGVILKNGVYVSDAGTVELDGSLYVNDDISGISNGKLWTMDEYVGYSGVGTFTQSNGTNYIYNNLYLGYDSTSTGKYNLSYGQMSVQNAYVGYSGNGTFTLSSGYCSYCSNLDIGYNVGSQGYYELSGGCLSALSVRIGVDGKGIFTQTGGHNNCNLALGAGTGALGYYDLKYGSIGARDESIGISGMGYFSQSGGSNSVGVYFDIGCSKTGVGYYYLSDGLLNVYDEILGNSGTGTFTQSGGTHTISNVLDIGKNFGSTGIYNLTGGLLILKSLNYGDGTAKFNFGGGTIKVSSILSSSLPMTLTGIGGNATIDSSTYAIALFGRIMGSGGMTKLGRGMLILAAQNSYSGDTVVQAGKLNIIGGIGDEGTSLLDIQAGKSLFQTTNIVKSDFTVRTASGTTFEIVDGTHQIGNITGSGDVTVDSGSKLTILDAVTMTGGKITVQNGACISFGTPYSDDHLYTVSGTHIQTIDDELSGAGGLQKHGLGTLILAGNNTYLGETTVSSGILQITGGCTLDGKISVASGAGIIFGTPYSLSPTPVPEPATWMLIALIVLMGAVIRLRKN